MQSIGEAFSLFSTYCRVALKKAREERYVRKRFYSNLQFKEIDTLLLSLYEKECPYRISKEFMLARKEKEIYVYGETPLSTFFTIGKKLGLSKGDFVLEMGCGRGRGAFFLASVFGCYVRSIDWIPTFIEKAQIVAKKIPVQNVSFACRDMLQEEVKKATCIYLCGTCLEDSSIFSLLKLFSNLPIGAKVVTVSYSLLEYGGDVLFSLQEKFEAQYLWGKSDVFIHVRK